MSVIFQLFCAEDLQNLTHDQLIALRETVTDALETTEPSKTPYQRSPRSRRRVPRPLSLEISLNTTPPENTPPQVSSYFTNRFHEVSHQLAAPQPNPPQPSFNFEGLRNQRNANLTATKEDLILQWALSCEINNFVFYKRLLDARKAAYEWYFKETKGQRPKGPDSPYSPFNPLHPLYNLFYGLSQPELHLPQDATGPSS